jgi:hypothetical protein
MQHPPFRKSDLKPRFSGAEPGFGAGYGMRRLHHALPLKLGLSDMKRRSFIFVPRLEA